jgi:hypothetical protein
MSSEEQSNAFNEVRAILGKLDRSIDEARSKRLEPEMPMRTEPAASVAPQSQTRNAVDLDREIGGAPQERAKTELQKKSATFGRAKPLNRNERPSAQWKGNGANDEFIG